MFAIFQRARRRANYREVTRRAMLDYWDREIEHADNQLAQLDANDPERPEVEANRALAVLRRAECAKEN